MKFRFLDKRLIGPTGKGRRPVDDGAVLVTVAPQSGRIYLSKGLVKRFKLLKQGFGFALSENGKEVFFYIDNKLGFRINTHERSYYVNSKLAVCEMLTEIQGDSEGPLCFTLEEESTLVDGKELYKMKLIFVTKSLIKGKR